MSCWIDGIEWEERKTGYWGKERGEEHWFLLSFRVRRHYTRIRYHRRNEVAADGNALKSSCGKPQEHLSFF
jgi:hypothetical protein